MAQKGWLKVWPTGPERPWRRRLRRALRVAEHCFAAVGALMLVYHLGFSLSVVASPSMSPTLRGESLEDGDWVLTERVSYCLRRPKRWEVATMRKADGLQVMKRVVGLPGEEVSLRDGQVTVDGEAAPRPSSLASVKYFAYGNLHGGRSVACGDGYFVLGDDSKDSQDSRFEGPVSPEGIKGRAWLIVWPLSRLGRVNP